jgi:osmoprotectant transport system permease protein
MKAWRRPLPWCALALVVLSWGMPTLRPVFAALFPGLPRPVYGGESFVVLTWDHAVLVAIATVLAGLGGIVAGVAVTRPGGRAFRPLAQSAVALGQAIPPVAVLAIAVPLTGFGFRPALIALALYGLLPVLEGTLAGFDSVPQAALDAARGCGMNAWQMLHLVEWPLALPLILNGLRVCAVIGIGTAAIASAVGASTLGTPIILGLTVGNTAYVLQGTLLVGLLAVTVDLGFGSLRRA